MTQQELAEILQWAGTLLSLGYVVLLTFNNVWAWPCGILGSAIMVYTFVTGEQILYMEAVSYSMYTLLGIYGLLYWLNKNGDEPDVPIIEWKWHDHLNIIVVGSLLALGFGYLLTDTNEARPYFDSFTTVFAMIGTFMQARKVLSNWWYWLAINGASIYLYWSTGFYQYALLSVVFTVLSVTGFLSWKKIYVSQNV